MLFHRGQVVVLLLSLFLLPHASVGDSRQVCYKVSGDCPNHPTWSGNVDDSDYGYEQLGVFDDADRCMGRAKEYYEWCGCATNQRIIMAHLLSGMYDAYPPFERSRSDENAVRDARMSDVANRYSPSTGDGDVWSGQEGGPLDYERVAQLLYARGRSRNHTAAMGMARGMHDPNAVLVFALLEGAVERRGLASSQEVIRRLKECAWEGRLPLCHVALGYRYQNGIGVEGSCELAAVHYSLAGWSTVEFNSVDGGAFPLHNVRISEHIEISKETEREQVSELNREKARRGDAAAAASAGTDSFFRDRDMARAGKLFEEAAQKEDGFGLNNLGAMLLNGLAGFPKDEVMAFKCFNQSASLVNAWGMYNLALCYTYGHGITPNMTRAIELLQEAASWKNPAALLTLGLKYRDGHGVPADLLQAYKYFDQAGEHGDVDALIHLGCLLVRDDVLFANCRVAVKAFKAGAERGPWGQLVKEGYDAYADGDVVGSFWRYRIAAEAGYRTAQANIAFMYEVGVNGLFEQDYEAAEEFYRLAANQGDVPSRRRLGDMYYEGRVGGVRDYARALEEWRVNTRDAQSVHNVAYMFERGLGVGQNTTEAMRLYDEAIRLGYNVPSKRRVAADSETSPYGGIASSIAKTRVAVSETFNQAKDAVVGALIWDGSGKLKPRKEL